MSVLFCSQTKLNDMLVKIGKLDYSMEDVMSTLEQLQADIKSQRNNNGDPKYLETILRKLQVNIPVPCSISCFFFFTYRCSSHLVHLNRCVSIKRFSFPHMQSHKRMKKDVPLLYVFILMDENYHILIRSLK